MRKQITYFVMFLLLFAQHNLFAQNGSFEGKGTAESPFLLKTAQDINQLSSQVQLGNSFSGVYFCLSDNVDMTGISFSPIGAEGKPFSGIFDGKGFCIKGISVNGTSYIGLFGYVDGAIINDVGVESANFRGSSQIGGIAGYSHNTKITNCYTRGMTFGNDCIGALVGYSGEGTVIQNCFSSIQHSQSEIYGSVGGLVGYNCGELTNSYYYGTINATSFERSNTGGIVGYNHTTGSIHYCYFLKQNGMNSEFDYCGSLNWGDCLGNETFDLYGVVSSGTYLHSKLNLWVTENCSLGNYRKWTSNSFPSFAEYAENNATDDTVNGHEFVDLGLPSGKLWAKKNYGAISESEYGTYVAWTSRSAIQETWGEEWSTPTSSDIAELYNNCTFTWETLNSVYGCRVTGRNGNSIFLPAAGYKIDGYNQMVGQAIYYWDDNEYGTGFAGALSGSAANGISTINTYNYSFVTMPIRPITKKQSSDETKKCGDNLTWTFSQGTNTLTISGTGEMWNYSDEYPSPWKEIRQDIKKVVVEEGVSSIGEQAFRYSAIESINLPNSLTSIGKDAFYYCINLSSIDIPNSVTTLGVQAFSWCTGLTSIKIPEKVTSINDWTFAYCSGLTSVDLSDGVVSIGWNAFAYCTSLKEIVLPKNVTTIDNGAFYLNLSSITVLNETPPSITETTFGNYSATLTVPAGCKTVYQNTDIWKNFTNIVEIGGQSGIITPTTMQNSTTAERYDLSGRRTNNSQRSVNVIRMKDGTMRKVVVK